MRKKRRTLKLFLIITLLFTTNLYLIACDITYDTSPDDSVETEKNEEHSSDETSDEQLESSEWESGDGIVKDPYTDFE